MCWSINMHRSRVKFLFKILNLQENPSQETFFHSFLPIKNQVWIFIPKFILFLSIKNQIWIFVPKFIIFYFKKPDLYFSYKTKSVFSNENLICILLKTHSAFFIQKPDMYFSLKKIQICIFIKNMFFHI